MEEVKSFPGKEAGNAITGWWAPIRGTPIVGGSGGVKRERGDKCRGRGGGEGGGGEGGGETEPTMPEK